MGEYEMISVIDYGAGNIQSVIKAFHHIGCEVQVTADREVISVRCGNFARRGRFWRFYELPEECRVGPAGTGLY